MGLNTSISALEMLISHTISTFHDVCVTNFDANMRFLTQNFTQENQILLGNFISHSDLERKEFHFVRRRTICPQTFAACFHPFQDGRKCGHTLRNYPSNQNLGQRLKSQNSDFHEIMIFEQQ